jgi:D-alanyl-D-alanine carboxypeptidase
MLNRLVIFAKKHKKLLLTIAIVLALVLFAKSIFFENGTSAEVKSSEKMSQSEQNDKIKANADKYQPKYDWLEKHPSEMGITAKSAIAIDQKGGLIAYAKNEHDKLPPASITKVLTLITVLENMKTDKLCEVSQKAADTQPNKIVMRAGEKLRVEDLLYGMMMISANDAAEVLAECYDGGRDKFIEKMNERVRLLGLKNSVFRDPNGLNDVDQLSSSYDMATITRYGLLTQPKLLDYMGKKGDYSVYPSENNESHSWYQISHLLSTYQGMEGAKTGYTHEAKNTYIGVASRENRRIIIVYFAAETTTSDATSLLEYGFSNNPNL